MIPRRVIRALLAAGLAGTAAVRARDVPLVILHTTDLHGRIVNDITERPDDRPEAGMLRAATLIRDARAREPQALLVDVGDTFQGAPETFYSHGRVMADVLNHLDYDAVALGNHEFDWGRTALARWAEALKDPLLCANWGARLGAPPPRARPWMIRETDGVRVAIVGLTTPGIPTWSPPETLGDWTIERSIPALERVMPEVRRERPDVMILAAHQGLREGGSDSANEIFAIAREFPDFDVILGGHTHVKIPEQRVGRALYAQAGWHGHDVGRVDLVYDTVQKRIVRGAGTLLRVDETVPADPAVDELTRPAREEAARRMDEVLGYNPAERPAYDGPQAEGDVGALLRAAIRKATGAEVVFQGALSRHGLPEGPVTGRRLWGMVPYENRIGLMHLTARELTEVLENALARRESHYTWGIDGIRMEWDPRAPKGARVTSVTDARGRPLHPRKRLVVAFNSYDLASAGGRLPALRGLTQKPETRYRLTELDTRTVVEQWIRASWRARPGED